ncbi:MAG TPA: hypothetical protein VL463_06665 [Kofleriaceae bacterium]|nr:hypothetical protein [Kofleriaceae bacterium]
MRWIASMLAFVAACAAQDTSSQVDGTWDYSLSGIYSSSRLKSQCDGTFDLIVFADQHVDGTWRCATTDYGGAVDGAIAGDDVHLVFDRGSELEVDVTARLSTWTDGATSLPILKGSAIFKNSIGFEDDTASLTAGHE